MSEKTNNADLELAILEKQAEDARAQAELLRERLKQLKAEQERKLNDPKERAKLLESANKMIADGFEEYKAKGFSIKPEFDDYGLFKRIIIKSGKSSANKTRGQGKSASAGGSIPGMTASQFEDIYESLGQTFKPADIVEKLVAKFGNGVILKYNPQPTLGKILADGYKKIKIEKVGTKGRNVYYKKIL